MFNLERKFAPFLNLLATRIIYFRPSFIDKDPNRLIKWNKTFNLRWDIGHMIEGIIPRLAALQSVFKTKQLDSFPVMSDPFLHDLYSQGMHIGDKEQIYIMWGGSSVDRMEDIVIFHKVSGQRLRVSFSTLDEPTFDKLAHDVDFEMGRDIARKNIAIYGLSEVKKAVQSRINDPAENVIESGYLFEVNMTEEEKGA